jgi:hypothetical protein
MLLLLQVRDMLSSSTRLVLNVTEARPDYARKINNDDSIYVLVHLQLFSQPGLYKNIRLRRGRGHWCQQLV